MGTLVGHVGPGSVYVIIGLWHLFNHIKLYVVNPDSYKARPWFPVTSKLKYLELFYVMACSALEIAGEFFQGQQGHPFGPDGAISDNNLDNIEHSFISMAYLIYTVFAIVLDRYCRDFDNQGMTFLISSFALSNQLLLVHFHTTDHVGPESQYHLLLQIPTLLCLITTLMLIPLRKSFLLSFVRSLSFVFTGIWFMVTGVMMWTPWLAPKGCGLAYDQRRDQVVMRCSSEEAVHRAKSLANLQFSLLFTGMCVFGVSLYVILEQIYGKRVKYFSINQAEDEAQNHDVD